MNPVIVFRLKHKTFRPYEYVLLKYCIKINRLKLKAESVKLKAILSTVPARMGSTVNYSDRRLLTGFATAARITWKLMDRIAMNVTNTPVIINNPREIEI